jgi:hypothetical protein
LQKDASESNRDCVLPLRNYGCPDASFLKTATPVAQAALQGLRDHVGVSADFALNVIPFPRAKGYGPFPAGMGWGMSGDLNYKDGLTADQNITAGNYGASGSFGITFYIPFVGNSNPVGSFVVSGGAGPGGAVGFDIDNQGSPTGMRITIGGGFGFEISTSASYLKK